MIPGEEPPPPTETPAAARRLFALSMMRDSDRYIAQADAVMRMAARASSVAERRVYETIAEGWRKLAAEARRNERHEQEAKGPSGPRTFDRPNSH